MLTKFSFNHEELYITIAVFLCLQNIYKIDIKNTHVIIIGIIL
jgi:hypothetical protein